MAASSRDDIPRQLAALLGRESVCQIRKTDTVPPRISVIDVVEAITGQVKSNAGKTLERIKESHPEVYPNWINFRSPGRGQRETPIADVRGIVEIVMLLPGRHAAHKPQGFHRFHIQNADTSSEFIPHQRACMTNGMHGIAIPAVA